MKNRMKDLHLDIGRVLNNPAAFGLGERMPKALAEILTRIQLALMEEIREQELEHDFLDQELSQDADRHESPGVASTFFHLPKTGT